MKHYYRYIVSIIILLLLPASWNAVEPRLKFIGLALTALGVAAWLWLRVKSNKPFWWPVAVVPMAAYVTWQTISLTFTSLPVYGVERVLVNWALLIAFLFFIDSPDFGWTASLWEKALISVAMIATIIELPVLFLWYFKWWAITGSLFPLPPVATRLSGIILTHPNVVAGFINLIIPLILIKLFKGTPKNSQIIWGSLLALSLGIIYLTTSRGGFLGVLIAIFTVTGLAFIPKIKSIIQQFSAKNTQLFKYILQYGLPALFLFSIVTYFFFKQANLGGRAPIHLARGFIWEPSWTVFSSSPIIGVGSRAFTISYMQAIQAPPGWIAQHAHNFWLQIAAESGLIGVGLALAATASIGYAVWRAWQTAPAQSKQQTQLISYISVGVALAGHHLVDYLFWQPLYTTGVFLVLALGLHLAPQTTKLRVSAKAGSLMIAAITALFIIGTLASSWSLSAYQQGLQAADRGDWQTAQTTLCNLAQSRPQKTLFAFQCGLVSSQLAANGADLPTQNQAIEQAIGAFEQGLARDAYWPVHAANLAALRWTQGNHSQAIADMAQVLKAAPENALFALNLGAMAEQENQPAQALAAYQIALDFSPTLKETVFFSQTALRRQAVALSATLPSSLDNWDAYRLPFELGKQALAAGNAERAAKIFSDLLKDFPRNATLYALSALAQQQTGNPETAQDSMNVALFLASTAASIQHYAAQLATVQGNPIDRADHLQTMFNLLKQDTTNRIYFSSAYYFGLYNQQTLPFDLVPQLKRALLTPEMTRDLDWLAAYQIKQGNPAQANEIRDWLSTQE